MPKKIVVQSEPVVAVPAVEVAPEPTVALTPTPKEPAVALPYKAFGIAKTPKGYVLAEIAFDTATGQVAIVKTTPYGRDRVLAKENFKLSVVKAGIL